MKSNNNLLREYKKALRISEEFVSKIIVEFGPKNEPLCYRAFAILKEEYRRDLEIKYGVGSGITKEEAIISAIYESLERISGSIPPGEDIYLWATYKDLEKKGYNALHPSELTLYLPEQYSDPNFPYIPFSEETLVRWVKGKIAMTNEEIYVPANFVYMYPFKDSYIFEATSNGLSAGKTFEEAASNALSEVIERDALMITWLAKIPRPHIAIKNEELSQIFKERFSPSGLEFHIIDITLDIKVPTVMVISIDRKHKTGIMVGASSKPNIENAIYKALLEGGYQGRETLKYFNKTADKLSPHEVETFLDHLKFYSNLKHEQAFEFLLYTEEIEYKYPKVDPTSEYEYIVSKIKNVGLNAIVVDVTTPEISEKGISVVRAIVPGTMQLNAEYKTRTLGVKRLYTVPKNMGYTFRDLNPYPHPLS